MNKEYSVVGKRVQRMDAVEKVIGRAKYGPDLKLDNMLHAKLLRSPYPHAKVVNIDTTKAEKHPKVKAVVTLNEAPKVVGTWFLLRNEKHIKNLCLLDNVVRFVGDPVLALAAEDEDSAQEALSLIDVEYEQLPAIMDPLEAMQAHAAPIHEGGNVPYRLIKEFGDLAQGFEDADYIIENKFATSKQKQAPIEPISTCIADYGLNGKLTVYSSSQIPHWIKSYIAIALGLPVNKVRIIKPCTGGAFGGRCSLIHGLEINCCFLSKKAGMPVKMSFTREESFGATEARHPFLFELKTGVTKDGIITANSIKAIAEIGGYGTHHIVVLGDALSKGVGQYRCPNARFEGYNVYTNKSLNGAFRGYGNTQMNFAMESQMDMVADKIGMDPLAFRFKNYRGPGERDPLSGDVIQSDGAKECLMAGAEKIKWAEGRKNKVFDGTKRRGIGMSYILHSTGASYALPDPSSATVMLNPDGSVNLAYAGSDDGQGNRTIMAQIVAETLGVDIERVTVSEPDTDSTPFEGGSHGSRQSFSGGIAVQKAAEDAKRVILGFASEYLKAAVEKLEIRDGVICHTENPDINIRVDHLLRRFLIGDLSICKQAIGVNTGVAPFMPPVFAADFVEVEVDIETGEVKILKMVGAYDVGKAINPAHVEGQITGGALMGAGYALTEGLITKDGKFINDNFCDYRILRACDAPEMHPIIVESHDPAAGAFGAKGFGEVTMIGTAAAIANAVSNAVGARVTTLPITQEKVLEAIQNVQSEVTK